MLAQTNGNSSSSSTISSSSSSSSVVEAYDAAVAELEKFRAQHKAFAIAYIAQWSKKEAKEVGTGGSDFVPALSAYKDATAAHKLAGSSSSSRGCPLRG
jgi:indoleamine 2,3-dioxygenase